MSIPYFNARIIRLPFAVATPSSRVVHALLLAVTIFAGCSGPSDELTTVPVTGNVTYKGEPVKFGTINFVPTKDGRPVAVPLKDGEFVTRIHENAEGLVPGEYKIYFQAYTAPVPSIPPQELVGESADKWLAVPKKYTSPDTTDLTLSVSEEDGEQDVTFDLKD